MSRLAKPGDPFWLLEAFEEEGVKEIPGEQDDPRVMEYLKTVDSTGTLKDDHGWCSAAHKFVMAIKSHFPCKGITAAARSWLTWGIKLKKPKRGCSVIFWRGSPDGWQGHITHFLEKGIGAKGGKWLCYGGNQGNAFKASWYSANRVLGMRWPPIAENMFAQKFYYTKKKQKLIGEQKRKYKDTAIKNPWYQSAWLVSVIQSIGGIMSILPITSGAGRGIVMLCDEWRKKLPKNSDEYEGLVKAIANFLRIIIQWLGKITKGKKP